MINDIFCISSIVVAVAYFWRGMFMVIIQKNKLKLCKYECLNVAMLYNNFILRGNVYVLTYHNTHVCYHFTNNKKINVESKFRFKETILVGLLNWITRECFCLSTVYALIFVYLKNSQAVLRGSYHEKSTFAYY